MTTEIVVPTPEAVMPGFADLPDEIQAVIEDLSKPFPVHEVKVRPGSVRRDGSAALCLAYADWWTGYLPRLNDAIGPNNWRISLQPWGENQIIARLSAFGGLIKKESSGSAKGEANGAQEAEVQAKKRVCAEGVLLGLFFYFLPKVWGKGERVGKDFYFGQGEAVPLHPGRASRRRVALSPRHTSHLALRPQPQAGLICRRLRRLVQLWRRSSVTLDWWDPARLTSRPPATRSLASWFCSFTRAWRLTPQSIGLERSSAFRHSPHSLPKQR